MSATDDRPPGAGEVEDTALTAYQEVQRSPEFVALRKRWRGFIFAMTGVFLAWFLLYVLLAAYATGFMNTTIGGTNFTIGLVFGLLQFVSTLVITLTYVRFADKNLDPEAERLRLKVEEKL